MKILDHFSFRALLVFPSIAALVATLGLGQTANQVVDTAGAGYRFKDLGDGVWSASNRSQGLRTRLDSMGLEVLPGEAPVSDERGSWSVRLRTTTFGRVGEPVRGSNAPCRRSVTAGLPSGLPPERSQASMSAR